MTYGEAGALARCQINLFTALSGALIAKGLISSHDICGALEVVAEGEVDDTVRIIIRLLQSAFEETASEPPASDPVFNGLRVVAGSSIS